MNIVSVKFKGTPYKEYYFNTNLNLIKNGIYKIVADEKTEYNNPITIVLIAPNHYDKRLRTITKAKLITAPPKPKNPYKKIIVNKNKETICVIWNDNTRTIMKPQPGDNFDVEKGIAMCFMKKWYDNRGCFNDVFKDIEVI